MTGVSGVFEVPILESRPESSHVSENAASPEVNYTFGQKTMTPKRASGYTKVSKRLIRMAGPGAENFIRGQLQKTLALTVHNALINGTGGDSQPIGLLNTAGFTSTDALSGGQFTVKHAGQMKTNLEEADFDLDMGTFGYLTRPIIVEGMVLDRTLSYSGQTVGKGYVFQPVLSKAELENRVGAKIATTTHVGINASNQSSVVYGDWSHLILALWSGLELSVSMDTTDASGNSAFLKNQVWIKADQEYDMVIDLPAAFTKVTDVAALRTAFTQY
jgi:hypothetical protein